MGSDEEIALARELRNRLEEKGYKDCDAIMLFQYVIVVKGRLDDAVARYEKMHRFHIKHNLAEISDEDVYEAMCNDPMCRLV